MAVLAQRLVRVVCTKCKQPYSPPESALKLAGITPELATNATFMKGKGCTHCSKSGFRGRLGIFELMMITPKIREMIYQGKSSQEIRVVAIKEGMRTLYADGIAKALRGVTTLEEVHRVAKRTEQDDFVLAELAKSA
jgi:type IV pilus assembly protein PilB